MTSVRLAPSALRDLQDIIRWHGEQGAKEAGKRIVAAILSRIEQLAQHPDMGRIVPEFGLPALREIVHPPYRIIYRRRPEEIMVIRVWHGRRHLKASSVDPGND